MEGYDEQIAAIEKGIAAREQTIKNLSTSSARVLKAGVTGEDLKKLKKEADERARKANEDEIKKRRHELIQKSVKEVSELMKQPMTIEVQATSTGSQETPAGGDAGPNGQNGNNPNSTTTNR